ncbi:MAG: hypothetical protein FWH48_01230 [Oscillospiraceae bacterium]|nr:hypothetical protein [Oscillospiraceae bacterium]
MKNIKSMLKSFSAALAINLVLAFVGAYFLLQFLLPFFRAVETERADFEISQDIVETYGYIFRNEEIIYSPGSRYFNYLVEDGQKVAKYQAIAQALSTSADFSAKDQIGQLAQKLDILDKSNINLEFVATNLEKINQDSYAIYLDMLQSVAKGEFGEAGKSKNELLILLNKKQLMTGEISAAGFESVMNAAKEQKRQLEDELSAFGIGAADIYANQGGIFYSGFDGYENYFTADAAKNLTFEAFFELLQKDPDQNILNNALGKVAYEFDWFIVCQIKKNKTIDFIEGNKYNIIYPLSQNKTIDSTLYKKLEDPESEDVMLIFELTKMPFGFDFSRKQSIQIVFKQTSGIKVPEEALRVIEKEDGTKIEGVYVQKGNAVAFRELPKEECLAKFAGYYLYCEPSKRAETGGGTLQLYEDIIVAGKDLYEGKAIK